MQVTRLGFVQLFLFLFIFFMQNKIVAVNILIEE